jgi:hypothetical protein
MSDPQAVGAEEMKMAAYGAYSLLKDNLPKDLIFTEKEEDDFIISALKRHGAHLSTHAINQDHVDPIKLLCWIGCAIIAEIKDETFKKHEEVLTALINSLEETLMLETGYLVNLTIDDRNLYHRMSMEEIRGNGDHGIGFNGLFVAFHSLRSTFQILRISQMFQNPVF